MGLAHRELGSNAAAGVAVASIEGLTGSRREEQAANVGVQITW